MVLTYSDVLTLMYLLTTAWHPYGTLGGAIQAVYLLGRGLLVVNHPVAGDQEVRKSE